MDITLHNTLTRKKEVFSPINAGTVSLYSCGPTVYNYAHIGNLRSFVFADLLKRVLLYNDLSVDHVMNITDVGHLTDDGDTGEDKMEQGAKREGKTAYDVADFYTKAFFDDIASLNILEANSYPRATEHINEQIEMVQKLIDTGYTYETTDGIYFDTTKLPDYGALAQLNKQNLKSGARVAMGEKKNPHDFALWKFSSDENRQMEWDAFGKKGFPGWHIECSAMSSKYLGDHFDIHTGGVDHIPVHHTNEIAQSEAVFEKSPWVNVWMHGEFLLIDSGRMGKSEGNFITMQTLQEKGFTGIDYRFFLLQTHYRKQLNFTFKALEAAQNGLKRLKNIAHELKGDGVVITSYRDAFLKHINDDLDIPGALALTWDMLKDDISDADKKATLTDFDRVLGLDICKEELQDAYPDNVQAIIIKREAARKKKDFDTADSLRDELHTLGYSVKDTGSGQKISKH